MYNCQVFAYATVAIPAQDEPIQTSILLLVVLYMIEPDNNVVPVVRPSLNEFLSPVVSLGKIM